MPRCNGGKEGIHFCHIFPEKVAEGASFPSISFAIPHTLRNYETVLLYFGGDSLVGIRTKKNPRLPAV